MPTISRIEDIRCPSCKRVWQVDTQAVKMFEPWYNILQCDCGSFLQITGMFLAKRLIDSERKPLKQNQPLYKEGFAEGYQKGYVEGLEKCMANVKSYLMIKEPPIIIIQTQEQFDKLKESIKSVPTSKCIWFSEGSKECYGKACTIRNQCNAWQNKK